MSLFGFLSKESRKAGALKKNVARVLNKHAQSADRMRSLELLADDGSDEAIYGLLQRFSYVYDKTIEDEQEKDWVERSLIDMGKNVLPMLRKYMNRAESISWPLRVLAAVSSPEEIHETLEGLVEQNEPGYVRDPGKKIQMLSFMSDHSDARMSQMILPYLADMDEGVRFATVEALLKQKDEACSREPLLEHFCKPEEESGRIKLRIIEGLAERGWPVKGFSGKVEKALPPQFFLDGSGHVKKKEKP